MPALTEPTCAGTRDVGPCQPLHADCSSRSPLWDSWPPGSQLGALPPDQKIRIISSFCDVNSTISCKQAYLSPYGSLGGVPVAVLGVLFFALILIFIRSTPSHDVRRDTHAGSAAVLVLSTFALGIVVYLAGASFFVLHEVCPLCVATYVAVIGLFVVSALRRPALATLAAGVARDVRGLVSSVGSTALTTTFVIGAHQCWSRCSRKPEQRLFVPPFQPLPEGQRVELEQWFDRSPRWTCRSRRDGEGRDRQVQ